MPLYEVTPSGLTNVPIETFESLRIYERADLQRLLRDHPAALGEDLLVIAEEYGQWEDARRRIDLLALDRMGRLVVIELKRTDDGGHMDLQALRYAAMVSSMGLEDVVAALSAHRVRHPGDGDDPRSEVFGFLGVDPADDEEAAISSAVRIILVSADFGREITTAVLWLNRFDGMDIRCVRLAPYDIDGKTFLDIHQLIPLPAAADYQVRLRRKEAARERAVAAGGNRDFTRFVVSVNGVESPDQGKRHAMRVLVAALAERGAPLDEIRKVLPDRKVRVLDAIVENSEAIRSALEAQGADGQRWFNEHPLLDRRAGTTYVLSNQWGIDTEPTMAALVTAFPETGVTFRRAEEGEPLQPG